jgi:hypothetical protein
LQSRPKILKKIVGSSGIGTSNKPIKTNIFQEKYVEYLQSVKEPNIHMEATRRNLQAQPNIFKNLLEHQINQSERKFSQIKYVKYLKSVKDPKTGMGLADGICGLDPKF